MSKTSFSNIILFDKDELTFKHKFYLLMNILIENQPTSKTFCLVLNLIFYIQIISGFFSIQFDVLNKDDKIDKCLIFLEKILRLKNMLKNEKDLYYDIIIGCISFEVFFILFFICLIFNMKKTSFYDYNKLIINYGIFFFKYIFFNIAMDLSLSKFCVKGNENLTLKDDLTCNFSDDYVYNILSIILFIFSIFLDLFINLFYNDSLILSSKNFCKIDCNYYNYLTIGNIIYSIILSQNFYMSNLIFIFYNLIGSFIFFLYYLNKHLFYIKFTYILIGMLHSIYLWTSIYFLIFYIFNFNNIGLNLIFSNILACIFFYLYNNHFDYVLFHTTNYENIINKNHLLYYLRNIIFCIETLEENEENKVFLAGTLEVHKNECKNPLCLAKNNKKIYLPKLEEWSNREKNLIDDKIFLYHYIIGVLNFFLSQNFSSVDMLINISLYYLIVIGNVCQSIFFYKKIKEQKLNINQKFSYIRLKITIENYLKENLYIKNKPVYVLKDLDTSLYFKYEDLSKKFVNEIKNDLNYSLCFWNILKASSKNFNEIFYLTKKINETKQKITKIFQELFSIYSKVNIFFDLYILYIENINDDEMLKRDLENYKRKNDVHTSDLLNINYYNILFGNDTGIIIANGSKGNEGEILKINKKTSELFGYSQDELINKNINILMPKQIAKIHNNFITKFYNVGEKKILGKKNIKTFAVDKYFNTFMIKKFLNMFPILNDKVLFIAMIIKEKNEDMILLDKNFIIQGMSNRLMYKLNVENKAAFSLFDIPFYAICAEFVGFYKNMIKIKTKSKKKRNLTKFNNIMVSTNTNVRKKTFFDNKNNNSNATYTDSVICDNNINNNNNILIKRNPSNTNNNLNDFQCGFSSPKNSFQKDSNCETPTPTPTPNNNNNNNNNSNKKVNPNLFFSNANPTVMNNNMNNMNNVNNKHNWNSYENSNNVNNNNNNVSDMHNNSNKNQEKKSFSEMNSQNENVPNPIFEITEKIELEYSIRIPNFILTYLNQTTKISNLTENKKEEDKKNFIEGLINIELEEKSSISDSENNNNNNINEDEKLLTKNNFTFGNNNKNNNNNNSNNNSSTKPKIRYNNSIKERSLKMMYSNRFNNNSDEQNLFLSKINKYCTFFQKLDFQNLEKYIEINYKEDISNVDTKFTLTFEKYSINENEYSYYIKVVENKNAIEEDEDDNNYIDIINNIGTKLKETINEIRINKKEKIESLKKIYKLSNKNKKEIDEMKNNLIKYFLENLEYNERISKSKKDIFKYSRVHGEKKEETLMEDENSSQTSANSSYNEDLSKKNRIEEIKNNTLKNVKNFYMLKYYRIILLIIIAFSAIFLFFFFILFKQLCNNLTEVTDINNKLYQTTSWVTFLLSTMISLNSMYKINKEKLNINFSTFIEDKTEYVNKLKEKGWFWYNKVFTDFSLVEKAVGKFNENSRTVFWAKEDILMYNNYYEDVETYPLFLYLILSNSNSLLNDEKFISGVLNTFNENEEENNVESIEYESWMAINNAYRNFLPKNMEKIKNLPKIFQDFNQSSMVNIRTCIIIYSILIAILITIYTFLLFFTNKIISEGFEKVSKIKNDKIDETIKKLDNFYKELNKFIHSNLSDNLYYLDAKTIYDEDELNKNEISSVENNNNLNEIDLDNNEMIDNNTIFNNSSNFFDDDSKKNLLLSTNTLKTKKLKLKLFTYSYLQPLILTAICLEFIIPIFFITQYIISSTNEIISIQNYLFGNILETSISLIYLKYTLRYHSTENDIQIIPFNTNNSLQNIIMSISKFDNILELYNNMRTNVCKTIFDVDSEDYNNCEEDSIINSYVNNTNSLFNCIKDNVEAMMQLLNTYIQNDSSYEAMNLFSNPSYNKIEYLYYNYLVYISDNIATVTLNNQKTKLNSKKKTALTIYILVIVQVVIYSFIIWVFFLKSIVYVLTITRSVLRIIPITVLYSTQELVYWIEDSF